MDTLHENVCTFTIIKLKFFRYRAGVAQRVGRGIALLFHDRGTRRGWVVSSTTRLYFTPGKDPVPILQEARWAPGPVWMSGKSRPHRVSIPYSQARSSVAIPTELPGPLFMIVPGWILLRMTNVSDQKKKHISCLITFSENRAFYETMWLNMVQPDGPQIT